MNDSASPQPPMVAIETQLMHLQYDFEQLSAECLRQQRLIQKHERRIESLEKQLRALMGGGNASSIDDGM